MVIDGVLQAREKRREEVLKLSKTSDVITLKANVPGSDKNTVYSKLLVSYFTKILDSYGVKFYKKLTGLDGETAIFLTDNGKALKRKFVRLENSHPLGRFIDIDVTLKGETSSICRTRLRKCFLCNKPAFYCGRTKAHTEGELLSYINKKCEEYFTFVLEDLISYSMLKELNLNDKFGLVSKKSNGSHTDLNYMLMKRAINAIKTPLSSCFFIGLNVNDCSELIKVLRPIGVFIEEKMYSVTNGANAYKGFIFLGGTILASVGYMINKSLDFSNFQNVVKSILQGFEEKVDKSTFGYNAYKTDNFLGIRSLISSGFLEIIEVERTLDYSNLLKTLTQIVSKIDDSVLYKRSKTYENYKRYKDLISNVNPGDKKQVKKINQLCVKNNISIGGSADVLISAIMLNKLKELFVL